MKKINSSGYGAGIAAAAGMFLVAAPLALLALNAVIPIPGYKIWIYISLAAGALIALSLIILLAVEFRQDKRINEYYRKHTHTKVYLGNERYECQSCGSRDVAARDARCRVCGIRFVDANNVE